MGATGRTGRLIVKSALGNGYEVNCLARNSHRIPKNERISVFEGSPINSRDLSTAMEGCNHVINALNISRKTDFPWSRLKTPPTLLSDTMKTLIPLAEEHGIKRVVICSAWGVNDTRKDIPGWFRWFIDNSNIGAAYRDHARQENLLVDSPLDWTIVQPAGLTNSKKPDVRESMNNIPKPSMLISRQSVAGFMVTSLKRDDLRRKKVVISRN